jgi:hypothetical protein
MGMGEWLKKRAESILDNLIFAGIVAGGVAVINVIKSLPTPAIAGISSGIFVGILLVFRFARRKLKAKPLEKEIEAPLDIGDCLTQMHRRLVELQKEKRVHTKIGMKQLEEVLPTLAYRMGIIKKIGDWPDFEERVKRRVKRAMPRRAIPRPNLSRRLRFMEFVKFRERARLIALSVALEVKDELFKSKEWTFQDGMKVSKWLDDYNWGVEELRDNDPQWKSLYESISHYLKDDVLHELIGKHIDFSYIYNNISLIICYSERYPKNIFLLMLHETLLGSPISPIEAERALSELLSEIEKRLAEKGDSTKD